MTYAFKPAQRTETSVLIGLAGPSGGGKTYSALRFATGLVAGTGKKIGVIDTEAGRALHYADQFDFEHCDMQPPFSPMAYQEAILAADKAGYGVIIVDSMSHEYEGEGGIIEWADRVAAQMQGNNKAAAWKEPKMAHKRFVSKLLQCRAHLIFCLRAEEKMLMEKQNGKIVIVSAKDRPLKERWVPICEKRFMYEMTASFLMLDEKPGIPVPLKLQEQHRAAFPDGKHIGEDSGKALAAWARGGKTNEQNTGGPKTPVDAGGGNPSDTGNSQARPENAAPQFIIEKGRETVTCADSAEYRDKMMRAVDALGPDSLANFKLKNETAMNALYEHEDLKPLIAEIEHTMDAKIEQAA